MAILFALMGQRLSSVIVKSIDALEVSMRQQQRRPSFARVNSNADCGDTFDPASPKYQH